MGSDPPQGWREGRPTEVLRECLEELGGGSRSLTVTWMPPLLSIVWIDCCVFAPGILEVLPASRRLLL